MKSVPHINATFDAGNIEVYCQALCCIRLLTVHLCCAVA